MNYIWLHTEKLIRKEAINEILCKEACRKVAGGNGVCRKAFSTGAKDSQQEEERQAKEKN